MNSQHIAHLRLGSQRVAGQLFSRPEEAVHHMGALQAQDYQQALWAIGQRTRAATRAQVEQAITDGKIVRTWPMRGTLHFVAAENAKWMLQHLAARPLAASQLRLQQLELDTALLDQCRDLFQTALAGGKQLVRAEMMQLLTDAGINPKGQRSYHILWHLTQQGVLCLGPVRDKEQAFVLLDEWVPTSRELAREEALTELAGTYFTSRGPATVPDFAGWAGITLADARAGLEGAKAGLVAEKQGNKEYWLAQSTPALPPTETAATYLLPGFDEYLLGYKDRSDVLPAEHAQKIVPGNNGVFLPVIVRGGQVVGTWKRTFGKKAVGVSLSPFAPLAASPAELAAAVKRFTGFVELPLAS